MTVTIYHNPSCSKSRATLQLIKDNGIEPEVVEYLKTPPDAKQLDAILNKLDMEPRDLMRKGEPEYQVARLDDDSLGRSDLIKGMIENPKLIERPIVLANDQAVIGRPPENVLKIL